VGGVATSQYNLGVSYMYGSSGLTKNAHCAKIYVMAAAKQGMIRAIEALKLLHACEACGAPRRPPHVPGLPLRYGHHHGALLQPRLPGGALDGPRA